MLIMNLKILKNRNGFSLLEIVITIIILGISLTAILESFIAGSATSARIANEITATNLAKQYMADLNYCSEGGSAYGVCFNFNAALPSTRPQPDGISITSSIWNGDAAIGSYIISPQVQQINNECFYTTFYPSGTNEYPTQYITLNDRQNGFNPGDVTINPPPDTSPVPPQPATDYILAVVKTEWFNNSVDGGNCTASFNPPAGANEPGVTLTMIFTNYNNDGN